MGRLPEPYRPFPEMTSLEQQQYVEARLWHARQLEICFVCEGAAGLEPYEGGFVCGTCRQELEDVDDLSSSVGDPDEGP